jgi:uncharacterized protein YchJ
MKNNSELSKTVHVDIISSLGHTEFEGSSTAAVSEIKRYVKEDGKWLYINGSWTSPDTVTPMDLEAAEDITLTNALAGG